MLVQALVEAVTGSDLSSGRFTFDYPKPAYHSLYGKLPACADRVRASRQPGTAAGRPGPPTQYDRGPGRPCPGSRPVPTAAGPGAKRLAVRWRPGQTPAVVAAHGRGERGRRGSRPVSYPKRTLARRLEREGCAYRGIREELLAEMAVRHLADSDLSIEAIAALLGYHDAANFRRAFRRWFQTTPAAYRRQSRGDGMPSASSGSRTPGPTPPARRPRWQSDRLPP